MGKYARKIDFNCCNHRSNHNKYLLGYTGLKCCGVAICLDCDKIQFVGGRVGRLLYPVTRLIFRHRIEIIDITEVETFELEPEKPGGL